MDWYSVWQDSSTKSFAPLQLSDKDEKEFEKWISNLDWFKELSKDTLLSKKELLKEITGPDSDYDYRQAWVDGVEPERYANDDYSYHWPSVSSYGNMLKSPTHPTSWMEYFMQQTGVDPTDFALYSLENARTWSNQYNSVLNLFPKIAW